jgi:hypothetical protein
MCSQIACTICKSLVTSFSAIKSTCKFKWSHRSPRFAIRF